MSPSPHPGQAAAATTAARSRSPAAPPAGEGIVRRYNRLTRWFHAATYGVTAVLLFTGWWLWRGSEGDPSVLAETLDLADTEIHRRAGWVLAGLLGAGVTLGIRAAWRFVRETLRVDRGDGRWFLRWPVGALTGRFGAHRGHFDPGQRLANLAFVTTFATLVGTGLGLTTVKSGPTFVWLARGHRCASYALVPLVVGHVLLAAGVLPGYRGVWRAMHLGGRVPVATVRRLWPATTPSTSDDAAATPEPAPEGRPGHRPTGAGSTIGGA